MNVLDLFKLEDFLQSEGIETLHVEFEKAVTLDKAVAPCQDGVWDSYKLLGKNILIFPSDKEEANKVYHFITDTLDTVKWTEECIMYIANDYKFRVIVSVNDTDI